MSETHAEVDIHVHEVTESLRVLARAAIETDSSEKMLAMLEAVGSMAVGIRQFNSLYRRTDTIDERIETPIAEEVMITEKPAIVNEPLPIAVEQPVVISEPQPEAPTQIFDLPLTGRERAMLAAMSSFNGEPFKKSDITSAPGIVGSKGGIDQSFTKLIHKLTSSPYADRLSITGKTSGRKFTWIPSEILPSESSEATPPEQPNPQIESPAPSATELPHTITPAELTPESLFAKFGLTLVQNGHRELSVRGIPLKLTPLELDVLVVLAKQGGQATYREILQSEELKQYDQKRLANDLNTALNTLETTFRPHDLKWSDRSLVVDGKKVRKIKIDTPETDTAPTEGPDFLA